MRKIPARAQERDKRIGLARFVYLFGLGWLLAALAFAVNVGHARADEPPPGKPVPIVTAPYWAADLPSPGKTMAVSDLNGDGRLEIAAAMDDGRLAAWDAFGNPVALPASVPSLAPTRLAFTVTVTGGTIFTATVTARDGTQLSRQMRDPAGRGFALWPGDHESSALVGDDEGLTLWRIGGQSLRFVTVGRPTAAWMGRLTPDGPVVVAVLAGKQVQVFGASSEATREGLLWRVPRPANEMQTSLEEDNAQELDKTGRKWWVFGSGETVYLIRNDGHVVAVRAPGPVTHVKLGDLDGDGVGEIVVSLNDGRVVALATDARARSVWQTEVGSTVTRLDVTSLDGRVAILALDESPALRLYAGDGQEMGKLELPFPALRHLVVDLNNDGKREIVLAANGDEAGAVVVTDARGTKLWQREQTAADWIAPLRSGGRVRAILSDDGDEGLVAYSPTGALLWRYKEQGAIYYDIADLRGDGVESILLSSKVRGPLVALDGNGRELWRFGPKPNVWMNTSWGITTVNGVRALFESWYTLAAGDNPDQSFVTRLDPATGQEVWTIRVAQTVYSTSAADTDGDGQLEIWAFLWPGAYRMDAETGAYLQVSEAKWSNNWFRVTNLNGGNLDQVAFYDSNGAELHGLVAEQPPWVGAMRAQAGQAGMTGIVLNNLLTPSKDATLSVTLAISLPVAGRWADAGQPEREEKSGRLLWTTTAFGPWDAGQSRAYELRVSDGAYTQTLTGALAIAGYAPPSVAPIEGGRYSYGLPLNAARVVTAALEILRPGSQTWETQGTRMIPPGSNGQWDVAPFGVWDNGKQSQARFVLDDGIRQDVFARLVGPQVEAQPAPKVDGTASGYQLSGQLRDPHAVTLTVEMFDPVAGWSIWRSGGWVETAQVVVPAGGGAFAAQVRSFYDAFDVGRSAQYRIWADDGTARGTWIQKELPPIPGMPWWAYLVALVLAVGVAGSGVVAILRQREARRLAYEMHVARAIQESLMPATVPSVPGLDIVGGSSPALEVGGDFFGYYRRENDDLGVAVGDVSGKGLPAALLMAVSVGILSSEVNRTDEPGDVLSHIDTVLEDYTRRNRLNTALCYVVLSRTQATFCVDAVNAGGIPPLLRRADGRAEWLEVSGLPLGIPDTGDVIRAPRREEIRRGDVLVLSSDGVVEAMNARREVFGFDRFERAVAETHPEGGAAGVREEILAAMRAFGAGIPPHDDVTLVVIRVM